MNWRRSQSALLTCAFLLGFLTLQFIDAGHMHADHELSQDCVLCQVDSQQAAIDAAPKATVPVAFTEHSNTRRSAPSTYLTNSYEARAPPQQFS